MWVGCGLVQQWVCLLSLRRRNQFSLAGSRHWWEVGLGHGL